MRALLCKELGPADKLVIQEVPDPVAGPGEVLVRILGAGICAGDAKCFSGAPLFWGDEDRQGYCQPPITPGHEFVGEVVESTDEPSWVGQRVVGEINASCGECGRCLAGLTAHCERRTVLGIVTRNGAFAEYTILLLCCGWPFPIEMIELFSLALRNRYSL